MDSQEQEHLLKILKNRNIDPISGYDCNIMFLKNDTGAESVRGTLLEASSSVALAASICGADDPDPIGSVLVSGIADGQPIPIGYGGIVPVLLEDATASTLGYWARNSVSQPGRADITNAAPSGGTITAINIHFREIGHCLTSVIAGTDQIAYIVMHFN